MKFRNLRIAWSAFWALAAVLLIALWVRSYCRIDIIEIRKPFPASAVGSGFGITLIRFYREPMPSQWSIKSHSTQNQTKMETTLGFSVASSPFELAITAPHWFVLSSLGIIAAFGRPPWRFSLRTLLIATTLVALVLGLVVYAVRK
jgi:hypothetical protein